MGFFSQTVYDYKQSPFGCFVAFFDDQNISKGGGMGFRYTFELLPDYMLVRAEGELESVEDWGDHAEDMIRKAADSEHKCILIDRRGSDIDMEVLDLVNVSNLLDERNLQNLGVRIAVLVDTENASLFNKLETSLTIRAFSYRIFGREDEALAWLKAGC